jgi:chemotaxis protein MotB
MSSQDQPPIIIIRKKAGHGAHHGGAWKVAYADFVTAMMALFIVLWLMNTNEPVRKSISSYFRDPSGAGKETGSASSGTGESLSLTKDDMPQLKDKLEQAMKKSPEFEKMKQYVEMSVTGEGLRIELLENERGIFFDSGSPRPSAMGSDLIRQLAEELSKLPNHLLIEGHTDSRPYATTKDYSNWELSSDRANAARRLMETNGLRPGQVLQVRGFADQQPRMHDSPEDPSNRRVSVIVCYQSPPPAPVPGAAAKPHE